MNNSLALRLGLGLRKTNFVLLVVVVIFVRKIKKLETELCNMLLKKGTTSR